MSINPNVGSTSFEGDVYHEMADIEEGSQGASVVLVTFEST